MIFRLASVPNLYPRTCLELQHLVTNEEGKPEWVHYCIVVSREQALELIADENPELLPQARIDLAGDTVLDGIADEQYQVRIAKHLLNCKGALRREKPAETIESEKPPTLQ